MSIPMERTVTLQGINIKLFSIRYLARSLCRDQHTIRRWQRKKVIPAPILKVQKDYRWYTEEEVEMFTRLFQQEKVTNGIKMPESFTVKLFAESQAIHRKYSELLKGN